MVDEKNSEMLNKLERGIKQLFPIGEKDSGKRIEFVNMIVPDKLPVSNSDYANALSKRGELTFPLKCVLNINGKNRDVKVLDYPVIFPGTGESIVGGNAYSPINLMVQRNGTYFNKKNDDDFEVQFNASGSRNFKFKFEPSTYKMTCETHEKSFPAYPILKEIGITDSEMKRCMTEDVYNVNKNSSDESKSGTIFEDFMSRLDMPKKDENETQRDAFKRITLDDKINEITLGLKDKKMFDKTVAAKAVENLMKMYKGTYKPISKESTVFKKIKTGPDFIASRLYKDTPLIRKRIKESLVKGEDVENKICEQLNKCINGFYINSRSSNLGVRINPLAIKEEGNKITKIGEGGITDDTLLTDEAKQSQYDSVGFIDPIHTPESSLTGVTLHMATGAKVEEGKITQEFFNTKTGKKERLNHFDAFFKKIAFPDDFDFDTKKFKEKEIEAIYKNEKITIPSKDAEYVIEPNRAFGYATNLIAALDQTQGNRAAMGAKQQTQAVPLVNREKPLFASGTEEEAGEDFLIRAENSGKVSSVTDKDVSIDGEKYEIPSTTHIGTGGILKYYPNVKVGDMVKKGDVVITTNFHDKEHGKELSLGTNVYTGYMPYEGMNIEDAIVVSKSCAKKFTSMHSTEYELDGIGENIETNLKKYENLFPVNITLDNAKKIGEDGIIKEGEEVKSGEIIIAAIRKKMATEEDRVLSKLGKSLGNQLKDCAVQYHNDNGNVGKVTSVIRQEGKVRIIVEYESELKEGDKLTGRYGNKGIVSRVLDDEDMPKDSKGVTLEMLLNPIGVPSRINPAQSVEIAINKNKNNQYKTKNFVDFSRNEKARENNSKETVFSNKYGEIDGVPIGKEYFMKLMHVVDKKMSARSNEGYTADSTPTKGGGKGGQSIDHGMIYGLASHGANNFLEEASNLKNQSNPDLWDAIAEGRMLPKAGKEGNGNFKKFTSILNAMGINTERVGNSINFYPGLSGNMGNMKEVENPYMLDDEFNPKRGGLFDYDLGGTKGEKWGKVTLKIPVKNPIFEKNIPIILGKTKEEIDSTKNKVLMEELKDLNIEKTIKDVEKSKENSKSLYKKDEANKRLRLLYGLKKAGVGADTYMLKTVPVLPPTYRPVTADKNTNMVISHSFNDLYKNLIEMNNLIKDKDSKLHTKTDDNRMQKIVNELYKGRTNDSGKEFKGLLKFIAGKTPKEGYFQSKVVKKRNDYTGRSTITPSVDLAPWEVGIPEKIGYKIFEPFVNNELKNKGYKQLEIQKMTDEGHPIAYNVLQEVSKNKPVLLNRAPSLHRYSTMGFMPVIHKGKQIMVHPLFTKPFNYDFDGDQMGVHASITPGGQEDLKKILASNMIFNEGYQNQLNASIQDEQISGIFAATRSIAEPKKGERPVVYSSISELARDFSINKLKFKPSQPVIIKGENSDKITSFGRGVINSFFPKNYRVYDKPITKNVLNSMLTRLGPTIKSEDMAKTMDDIRVTANFFATKYPISVGVEDLLDLRKIKGKIIEDIKDKTKNKSEKEKHRIMFESIEETNNRIKEKLKDTNNFLVLSDIGAKGNKLQTQQILGIPGFVLDTEGNVSKNPIVNSYGEGLRLSEYFSAMPGVRKGMIGRAQATAFPGALAKVLVNNSLDETITTNDCGTKKGEDFSVDDVECLHRLLNKPISGLKRDTVISQSILDELKKLGIKTINLRSVNTCEAEKGICSKCFGADTYGNLRPINSQIGVEAAQTLSEPLTQAAMNAFHTGGLATISDLQKEQESNLPSGVQAVQQAFYLSDNRKGAGIMAMEAGKVKEIRNTSLNEKVVSVGERKYKIPNDRKVIVKIGDVLSPGDMITDGNKNMNQLFEVVGKDISKFRPLLSKDLKDSYGSSGRQSKRMFDVMARSMTNTAHVIDANGNCGIVDGDIITLEKANFINKNKEQEIQTSYLIEGEKLSRDVDLLGFKKGRKISRSDIEQLKFRNVASVYIAADSLKFEPIIKGILTAPHKKYDDVLNRINFNRIPQAISEAASIGMSTNFNGASVIPRFASGIGFEKFQSGGKK